tara:strand:- start:263125 stop:263640 length:516 start_codon:yes stop_codon:yes gene_type:complete
MAKKKKELLPFPRLLGKPEACLGCGYPLDGIPAPGSCPECGMEFYDQFSGLQIAGVAKKSGGPAWRRAVWIVIAIISFLYFNVIGVLIFTLPWMALVIFLAIVAGVLAMIIESQQEGCGVGVLHLCTERVLALADRDGERGAGVSRVGRGEAGGDGQAGESGVGVDEACAF